MNREELAWAAGVIDGEGCWMTNWGTDPRVPNSERRYPRPRLSIAQSSDSDDQVPEILSRVRRLFPFLRLRGPYHIKNRTRPAWQLWAHGFERTQAVAAALWPWMGGVKRAQYKRVMSDYLERTSSRKNRLYPGGLS